MKDYDLVVLIKNSEDSDAKQKLWLKYQPLVHKHLNILRASGFTVHDREDFLQDSYLVFLKTLDYIQLDKIKDSAKFYLYAYFNNFLRNERTNNYAKKERFQHFAVNNKGSYNKFVSVSESALLTDRSGQDESLYLNSVNDFIDQAILNYDDCYAKIDFQDFRDRHLDNTENTILDLRTEGYTLSDIGDRVGYSLVYVKLKLDSIKKHYMSL